MASDDSNLTLEKLMEIYRSLPEIPQYEIQLGLGQLTTFGEIWERATNPIGPAPQELRYFTVGQFGGIPVEVKEWMPPGCAAFVQKRKDGTGEDLLYMLYFREGNVKVIKLNPLEQFKIPEFKLNWKVNE